MPRSSSARRALHRVAAALEAAGADPTVEAPGAPLLRLGGRPDAARVPVRTLDRRMHAAARALGLSVERS
jgi:hypothetical protein